MTNRLTKRLGGVDGLEEHTPGEWILLRTHGLRAAKTLWRSKRGRSIAWLIVGGMPLAEKTANRESHGLGAIGRGSEVELNPNYYNNYNRNIKQKRIL